MISGLAPIIYGSFRYKAFSVQLKALFIYLIVSVCIETGSFILMSNGVKGNFTFIQFAFSVFECLVITYIFWLEFKKPSLKITIVGFVIIYLIGLICSYAYTKNIGSVTDVADIMEASFIIILSVIFFFNVFTDLEIPKLTSYPFFWLNSAFIVYFGTAFFLFLFNNEAKDFDKAIVYFLTAIHHIVNISYNILITIAICKVKKP